MCFCFTGMFRALTSFENLVETKATKSKKGRRPVKLTHHVYHLKSGSDLHQMLLEKTVRLIVDSKAVLKHISCPVEAEIIPVGAGEVTESCRCHSRRPWSTLRTSFGPWGQRFAKQSHHQICWEAAHHVSRLNSSKASQKQLYQTHRGCDAHSGI